MPVLPPCFAPGSALTDSTNENLDTRSFEPRIDCCLHGLYAPRLGTRLLVLVDKRRGEFASEKNEHHMQLKIGLNNLTQIYNVEQNKVMEIPGEDAINAAVVQLPDDLFHFDFAVS
jgi:hypothetical protein